MSEHALSVTLKAGRDFDAPWVVVYGDNPDDVAFKLNNIEDVLKGAVTAAATLRSLHTLEASGVQAEIVEKQQGGWSNSAPQAQPQWSQPQQQAAPQVPQVRLHPEGKTCACGQTLIFKEITAKTGKQYQMWTCPSQQRKGDGHDSEFVNKLQ